MNKSTNCKLVISKCIFAYRIIISQTLIYSGGSKESSPLPFKVWNTDPSWTTEVMAHKKPAAHSCTLHTLIELVSPQCIAHWLCEFKEDRQWVWVRWAFLRVWMCVYLWFPWGSATSTYWVSKPFYSNVSAAFLWLVFCIGINKDTAVVFVATNLLIWRKTADNFRVNFLNLSKLTMLF